MPKETTQVRDFLKKSRRADAKFVKVKKNEDNIKFKLRLSKYLYTLVVPMSDASKAKKIYESFPPGLDKDDFPSLN